jgi:hypothetical protein
MRRVAALACGVVLSACGADPELPTVTPPVTDPPADPCVGFSPTVAPITGSGPLHRTTPVTARWAGGEPADLAFVVTANGAPARGTLHVRSGEALFLPERAFPGDARVEWSFSACGVKRDGHFTTGALMAPVELDAAVGRSFGFDLRAAGWEQPKAASTVDGFILRWHLAPSFVVDVLDADLAHATIALAPGVIDDDGHVVRDLRGGFIELETGLLENPYLHVTAPELSVLATDGEVVLRRLELVLGVGEGCFTDSRLVAVMDVRHLEKEGLEPCARLQSLTGESCVLCDDGDEAAGCFLLAVDGLTSVSSTDSSVPVSPKPLP